MFKQRIQNLQKLLKKYKIESLLVTSPYNIAYLSGIHNFSVEEREARIFITKKNTFIFTDARYTEMVKVKSPHLILIENSYKFPFSKSINKILKDEKISQIGFEEEHTTYAEAAAYEEKIEAELIPVAEIVEELRELKDEKEIEKIKATCALTDMGFDFILKHLKPGVTENEIKNILENFIREKDGALSFESIIAFGKNSAIPHHLSGNTKLSKNDAILLDFGAKLDNYCSDMTRTVFIGSPIKEIEKMYNSTLESQIKALEYLKTHTKKSFKSQNAAEIANKHLKSKGFGAIPHGLGHGVGLQVHENPHLSPVANDKIRSGNIVTVEPGIYIAGLTGIRIEDTILITTEGIEILTKSSKNLIVL